MTKQKTALEAFVAKKTQIDEMLNRLLDLSEDHFGVSPDDINWGHVGTLSDYIQSLKLITDSAFKEGEHA